jgi:hypothetical protein
VFAELGRRLWEAAEALRANIGVPWRPEERLLHEPQLAAPRSRLDEASWETAFAEGNAMTIEIRILGSTAQPRPYAAGILM